MPTARPSSDQGGEHSSIGVAHGNVEGVVGSYGRGAAHGHVASGDRITGNMEIAENKAGNQKMELNALMTIVPDSLNSVTNDGWEEIEMTVDSGASETVVGEDMISAVATKEGQASRRGVVYEVANGVRIPNLGEKQFVGDIPRRHQQTHHRTGVRCEQRAAECQKDGGCREPGGV